MLKQRVITAVVLIAAFGAATIALPPFWFALLISAVILAAGREWSGLLGGDSSMARPVYLMVIFVPGFTLFYWLGISPLRDFPEQAGTAIVLGLGLAFWLSVFFLLLGYPDNRKRWDSCRVIGVMGLFALLPGLTGVVYLKYLDPTGHLVLALVILVAAVDIGAYFAGRRFGRRQLAPEISPKKTWEGVWGGSALSIAIAVAFAWTMHRWLRPLAGLEILLLAALAPALVALCVIGDLLESMLKRNRQAKDSGSLLPGHGGLLDRVDSLLAATPAFVLGMMFLFDESAGP